MKSNGIEKRKMTPEREMLRNGIGGKHIHYVVRIPWVIWENKESPIKIGR